jgi:hypothetical protein
MRTAHVSPASITFAKQLITTTSGAKAVTITNTGASAQPIVITISGDFTETDNCSGSVAAGGSCSASLFFTPTLVGAIKGAASIYDSSNSTSVMAYRGARKPLPQIARELNVDAVMEGTVLRSGDQVRITAQLSPLTKGGSVECQ